MNFFICLMLGVLVIIPEYLVQTSKLAKTADISRMFNFEDFDFHDFYDSKLKNVLTWKSFWNLKNYVANSLIFYGRYKPGSSFLNFYYVPLAYLLVTWFSFLYSFVVISIKIARNASNSKMQTNTSTKFTTILFAGWDFSIGNAETAANKKAALTTAFREALVEKKHKEREQQGLCVTLGRILAHLIVLVLMLGSGALIFFVNRICHDQHHDYHWVFQDPDAKNSNNNSNSIVGLLISVITWLYPSIFELVAKLEFRPPQDMMRWQLVRVFILYLFNLGSLFNALLDTIKRQKMHADEHHDHHQGNIDTYCWETRIGEEFITLSFFDLLFLCMQIFGQDFVRGLVVRHLNRFCFWNLEHGFPGYAEFKLADNTLHLIYNQGISWMGTYFCPGMPIIFSIKLILLMYLRKWCVLTCNTPNQRIFRIKNNNFNLFLLLIMLVLCVLPVGIGLFIIPPSKSCGPFQNATHMWRDKVFGLLGK